MRKNLLFLVTGIVIGWLTLGSASAATPTSTPAPARPVAIAAPVPPKAAATSTKEAQNPNVIINMYATPSTFVYTTYVYSYKAGWLACNPGHDTKLDGNCPAKLVRTKTGFKLVKFGPHAKYASGYRTYSSCMACSLMITDAWNGKPAPYTVSYAFGAQHGTSFVRGLTAQVEDPRYGIPPQGEVGGGK